MLRGGKEGEVTQWKVKWGNRRITADHLCSDQSREGGITMDRNPLRPQPPPKLTPVPLDANEQIVMRHLRSLTDYGWGDLTVEVRNNGEIMMVKEERRDLVTQQRRRD